MADVLFIQPVWTENLGPMYLSAFLKKHGHSCSLIIEAESPADDRIQKRKPDIIAFSVTTGMHQWALKRTAELKSRFGIKTIMGGPHATYYPEVIRYPSIDYIARGEAELAFLRLCNALDRGEDTTRIPNIWTKNAETIIENEVGELIEDLDTLPLPDRELYYKYPYLSRNENKAFISGRGCPYSCTYCSIAGLRELYKGKGTFVRFHSPERVIEEIAEVRDRYGLRSVVFQDDTFIIGESRLARLLDLYRMKIKLPFICHVRADLVTAEIARLLKDAGCHSVDFGVESGDETLRTTVLGKTVTNVQLIMAAESLHLAGIPFRTTNMFGLPGETIEQAWETIKLNRILRTNFPSASLYQPYPRTALGDQVIQDSVVPSDFNIDAIGSSFFRSSILEGKDKDRFINLQKLFWPAVRFPFTETLIKRLIRWKPNFIFELIFLFFYGLNYALSENVSFKRVISLARHTVKTVFFGRV